MTGSRKLGGARGGWLGLFLCVCLLAGACGKKGPPVPPRSLVLGQVTDLAATAVDCTVVLRWGFPRGGDNILLTGFSIFRTRRGMQSDDCADCPPDYREIAKVYISDLPRAERDARQAVFTQNLDCGYEYGYTVVGFTRRGVEAPASNAAFVVLKGDSQVP